MRLKNIVIFTVLLTIPIYSQDWATLQNTLIKYYRYQRSGLKPTTANATGNPYNPFYTHTGSGNDAGKYPHWSDGGNTPLDGGWYDAGDFMKFGLPLGFAVYCLLKGYDAFPDPACYDDLNSWSALGTKDNIPDILNEAKVGTDYLIKAVISSSQVAQTIGNGPTDHGALNGDDGYANSTRTASNRPVRYCDGADVPGFYSAALALMSILYKPYDAAYSATCLQKAKDAYTFATGHLKTCSEQIDQATQAPFYSSTTYQDKLACAAIELYRATKDATYLAAAKAYFIPVKDPHYDVLGYAHGSDLAAFELYRSGDSAIKSTALGSLASNVNIEITRVVKMGANYVGGATVNTTDWGVCRTVGNSAFSAALLYTTNGNLTYKQYAIQQVKWLAGLAPFTKSWITQYNSGPQNPHSRNDVNLKSVARLTGGVVSGPSALNCTVTDKSTCSWTFSDVADNYKNTECALDYGCGAIGAVAFIRWTAKTDSIRLDSGLVATPAGMDLAMQTETIKGVLSQAAPWTVILKGETSKAIKTYTGTTANVLIQGWKGDKDSPTGPDFTVERVSVYFDTTKMKIWDVQRSSIASTYFNIINIPGKAWGANDVEIDNFEDTARLTNLLGGKWSGFYDVSDSVAGGKSSPPMISSDSGRASAKGLYFSLTRSVGATTGGGPYAGIRTTFNAAGSPVNLGTADTIMFDIKPLASGDSIWVQIEQSDIVDKAYFGSKLTFGSAGAWVRAYFPMAALAQPSWKTTAKALNLKSVNAIRFVSYGAASSRFILDNLRISNLKITQNAVLERGIRAPFHTGNYVDFYKVSPGSITYGLFLDGDGNAAINAEVFDCLGKKIASYKLTDYKPGKAITVSGLSLHAGIYFLKHTNADTRKSIIAPMVVNK
jgi:hypothetical protein